MIQDILKKYWGYTSFRPHQEAIIRSVLKGNDTLGLLPTGGGKSICFQVPAMLNDGICVVISPLIALMKDQVENLKKRGIKAERITSDLRQREIDIILDNCVYGDIKFLYVSPERLSTELFIERVKKMKVNLLAIDEAHCISQWGYDFRPSYLQINEIRKLVDAPVLALTATATTDVVVDIQEKLNFSKPNVFQGSYIRTNLVYVVYKRINKYEKLIEICKKIKGTGIVYASTRKRTKEIADFLIQNKISANYFHAGLNVKTKNQRQEDWMKNKTQVIVATNAFGMGIDKPDVRFVIHMDIPNTIESYFQEAGRGGRDEKKAYAVLLYNEQDILDLEYRVEAKYPPLQVVKMVYRALANHLQIAYGSGQETMHDFILSDFSAKYDFKSIDSYNSLRLLENAGYINLGDAFYNPSRLMVVTSRKDLYNFQLKKPDLENLIKLLLRNYDGIFDVFVKIDENELARKLQTNPNEIKKKLKKLHKIHAIHYIPQSNTPKLFFIRERVVEDSLIFDKSIYAERKELDVKRMIAIKNYIQTPKCRSKQLVAYFGEHNAIACGKCDVCLERKKIAMSEANIDQLEIKILHELKGQSKTVVELAQQIPTISPDELLKITRWMVDSAQIQRDEDGKLYS